MAALCSCSTISHTASTADVDTHLYNLTVADMKVSDSKVSKTIQWDWVGMAGSDKAKKDQVTSEALKDANADLLVEPQYIVNKRGLFRGGSVTVTGYPATYSNFRPLTQADADIIATLNGKNLAGQPCHGVSYPVIATSKRPRSYKKAETIEVGRRHFLNLVGGPVIADDSQFDVGPSLGLMYGSYGKHWGWYGKLLWSHASAEVERHYYVPSYGSYYGGYWGYTYEREHKNGFILTFGAIKTITRNLNVLVGIGFGLGYDRDNSGWDEDFGTAPALPFEGAIQWTPGKFNITAGCTGMPTFGDASTWNIAPFVGIGFSI